jgi:acid phosphatase family membrane protein YuiD
MFDLIRAKPFLVAILAGACAQLLKALSFLIAERKVNYRRLVQTDGAPNMHATAFSALAVAVGMREGFDSLVFAFAVCLTAIIVVDTMNVKNATSRQAEAVLALMDRLRKKSPPIGNTHHSYTPMDVFTGLLFGTLFAIIIV